MATFRKLCELAKPGRDNWQTHPSKSDLGEQSMSVIKRGLEIRPDRTDGNTFWDDFVTVLGNNSEGASKLLGVSRDVVSGWSSKIKAALDRVREENESDDTKKNMIQTGTGDEG